MAEPQTTPRFPDLSTDDGHYESFYLKASRPGGGEGIWIRHTVHKRPGADPTASVWVTYFNTRADGPVATKATFPAERLSKPDGGYIEIAEARLEPGRAIGAVTTEPGASWELELTGAEPAFHHLPHGVMYGAPVPRTKLLSPHPNVTYSGTFAIGDHQLQLDGWPGMVGHNWGAEHAHRWIWMHGAGFADRPSDAWFDAGLGRVKLGPLVTPWIANGVLALGGERYRLGGLGAIRSTRVNEQPTGCDFRLEGSGIEVAGRVAAQHAKDCVGWRYADPQGPEHHVANCSVADMELSVRLAGESLQTLALKGGAAYETGMRPYEHGIPLQPFDDG